MHIELEEKQKEHILESLKDLKILKIREEPKGIFIERFIQEGLSPNFRIVLDSYDIANVTLETSSGVIPDEIETFTAIFEDYQRIKKAFEEAKEL